METNGMIVIYVKLQKELLLTSLSPGFWDYLNGTLVFFSKNMQFIANKPLVPFSISFMQCIFIQI